ncbi:MAG: gamma-glutamyltransferase [Hyphomicrobiaceae bacterium]
MRRRGRWLCAAVSALLLLAIAPALAQDQSARQSAPEADTGWGATQTATASRFMVTAANPLAVEAGVEILKAGGSAVDAAIAVQMVLNVVEPQSSGIGGGGFLVHFTKADGSLTTFDGRETAPASAKPDRFLLPDGKPRDFDEAVKSGLSIGTPGNLRMLELAHKRFGKLPWKRLFEPAIRVAETGFPVSTRLNLLLYMEGPSAFDSEAQTLYFSPSGWPRRIGSILRNPELAATLRIIAEKGPDAFYSGPLAEAIVADAHGAPTVAGDLTTADLAGYRAIERAAVCAPYRGYSICGMGPPSSGGTTVAQTLALLDGLDVGSEPLDRTGVGRIAEAEKLAYADRDRYLADPDFVAVPSGLLDAAYIAERRKLIDADKPKPSVEAGTPPTKSGALFGADNTRERHGTSHVSIVDAEGNAVSFTTSIEGVFGAHRMVQGFFLNNQLTDFAFKPADKDGLPVANRVEAGKRPRSSMAPTIVLGPDGKLFLVTGSPGGSRIILYVVKSIVCVIDWTCSAGEAAELVNFGSRNGPLEVESGFSGARLGMAMWIRGHKISPQLMTSGVHLIIARDGHYEGAADPRREGTVRGE